jgi:hypothetical protein
MQHTQHMPHSRQSPAGLSIISSPHHTAGLAGHPRLLDLAARHRLSPGQTSRVSLMACLCIRVSVEDVSCQMYSHAFTAPVIQHTGTGHHTVCDLGIGHSPSCSK